MNANSLDFLTRLLGIGEQLLGAGLTLGPQYAALFTLAKAVLTGGSDPTQEQWDALDAAEETAFKALQDASK
jgi:hypothetical protein